MNKIYAYDAIVIVLEAPLLKEPRMSSTVLQTVRKGSRVYIPTEIGDLDPLPAFIQTYDRVGNIAYVPTKYIKIVTNELSESKMPISYPNYDPTDYRIEEPIPTSYPFDDTNFLRANIALTLGNNIKAPYEYGSTYSTQKYSNETGVRLTIGHKVSFDNYDRYYFGIFGAITTTNNEIDFQNNGTAKENRSLIRVGPQLTYDVFKNSNYRLTLGTGFTYNFHKSTLKVSAANGDHEERLFSGYSLSPFTNTMVQMVDVLPKTDLIAGADFNFYLPHNQTTKDDVSIPELWGGDVSNQIHSGFKAQVSFFLGVQVKY
jgi:hypothetical protein